MAAKRYMRQPGSAATRSSVARMSSRSSDRRPAIPWMRVTARTVSATRSAYAAGGGHRRPHAVLVARAPGARLVLRAVRDPVLEQEARVRLRDLLGAHSRRAGQQ